MNLLRPPKGPGENETIILYREMGGKVGNAPACYGRSLVSNLDIFHTYKMGCISKGLAITH
jgi:hypothetical protein